MSQISKDRFSHDMAHINFSTGADEAVGRQLLEACGGNLELAVDMHMEGAVTSQPSTSGAQDSYNR